MARKTLVPDMDVVHFTSLPSCTRNSALIAVIMLFLMIDTTQGRILVPEQQGMTEKDSSHFCLKLDENHRNKRIFDKVNL
ncbi:hypothetical protein C0J52_12512 [Blattella germanica]|nr:hypothetical protein C0J52_12512 [Blattella germanica]